MNEEFTIYSGNLIGQFLDVYMMLIVIALADFSILKYERLAEWYYHCGITGHIESGCPTKPVNEGSSSSPPKYGNWLKATGYWNPSFSKRPVQEPDPFHAPDDSGEEVAPYTSITPYYFQTYYHSSTNPRSCLHYSHKLNTFSIF
ncbi:OLC1v1008707C1 [Oldenlandia corymbosa var. corymbosa]|uniref:OLC1v1008707C1 n=1 Tax=Oldenlandia corymbosa var. corymbosa TaxID=529605 RepID=A0AAV1DMK8_OLDCO|nr:OLC1v1008707C1 [Oldenlandia corymbosa var. corymbosa]